MITRSSNSKKSASRIETCNDKPIMHTQHNVRTAKNPHRGLKHLFQNSHKQNSSRSNSKKSASRIETFYNSNLSVQTTTGSNSKKSASRIETAETLDDAAFELVVRTAKNPHRGLKQFHLTHSIITVPCSNSKKSASRIETAVATQALKALQGFEQQKIRIAD